MTERDTIAAISTPPGRGGIGIVRLSGAEARACATRLMGVAAHHLDPGRARFTVLHEPATGVRLDEAVVTYFAGPHSYTGEDVVEIAAHGSPVLLAHLLQLLLEAGARLAEPGEFTERAFISGRLDLTQAEAVRDLIDAKTLLQVQVAAQQMGGSLSRIVAPVKEELVRLIAVLEAGIDFAEDETPVIDDAALAGRLSSLHKQLSSLQQSFNWGRLISEGIAMALVGRPNAGKSSLFNRLLERERAIVTAEPGTTRDLIEERLSLGGIPVRITDTAGIREGASEAERMGIARSREALAEAGLVLLVLDASVSLNAEELALLRASADRALIIAVNKCDLLEGEMHGFEPAPGQNDHSTSPSFQHLVSLSPAFVQLQELHLTDSVVLTSARTGEGLPQLRQRLELAVSGKKGITAEDALITNLRQHTSIKAAVQAIGNAQCSAEENVPHEMLLLDLYAALRDLDSLTGITTADDVLNLIFSTFCIGK